MRTTLLLVSSLALAPACTDPSPGSDDDSAAGDDDGSPASGQPVADFYASPWQAQVGQTVELHADPSTDGAGVEAIYSDCDLVAFHWDFGDGQNTTTDVYFLEHAWSQVGTYGVTLTVEDGEGRTAQATANVEVVHPPPVVTDLDVSVDAVAVIGEWVRVLGEDFRPDDPPAVTFGGMSSTAQSYVSEGEIRVQVPPTTPSGPVEATVTFPDGTGTFRQDVWVKRFALVTDAFHDQVHVLSFGEDLVPAVESQSIEIESATVVELSGDGATALVGDGRYELNLAPTISFVDLTADFQPVVTRVTGEWGLGPLFDIGVARDVPRAVIADVSGLTVVDFTDPYAPVSLGRTEYAFEDLAGTDVEVTPDGLTALVLGTFDDQVHFYSLADGAAEELPWTVACGAAVQDLRISPDGATACCLGGGGEGAIPPDLSFDNTTLAVIDLGSTPPANRFGAGTTLALEAHAPVPFDLDVGASGRIYVSSFDQNFEVIATAFEDLFSSFEAFFDIGMWESLIEAFGDVSFGGVTPFEGVPAGAPAALEPLWVPYGFQTGVDVRYDEAMYVASAVFVDFVSDTSDLLDFYAELNMSVGVVVGDLGTGETRAIALAHEPLLFYDDLQFDYDLSPLVDLVTPPFSYGDVALQP